MNATQDRVWTVWWIEADGTETLLSIHRTEKGAEAARKAHLRRPHTDPDSYRIAEEDLDE